MHFAVTPMVQTVQLQSGSSARSKHCALASMPETAAECNTSTQKENAQLLSFVTGASAPSNLTWFKAPCCLATAACITSMPWLPGVRRVGARALLQTTVAIIEQHAIAEALLSHSSVEQRILILV